MASYSLKTYEDVNDRLGELYEKLMTGKEKHYVIKEAANVVGKHIANVKNKLVYAAPARERPGMDNYFGMEGAEKRLTKS